MTDNLQRMLRLVEETFDTRNDPDQLQVTRSDLQKLEQIHPSTLSQYDDGEGPVCWILMIPTSTAVMHQFLNSEISERQILELTSPGQVYEAIYLCSASVLQEYRNKGIAKNLSCKSIDAIRSGNPVEALYVWPFSEEGKILAEKIAYETNLPLFIRFEKEKSDN